MGRGMAMMPFRVVVEGRLIRNRVWQVDAKLAFEPEITADERRALRESGRLALFRSIMKEAARGREHGARSVLVRMAYEDVVREFEIGDVAGDLEH